MTQFSWDDVVSSGMATIMWDLNFSTIRKAILEGRLVEGVDCKKEGRSVFVLKSSLEKLYGPAKRTEEEAKRIQEGTKQGPGKVRIQKTNWDAPEH